MTDNLPLPSLRDYVTEKGTNIFINCTSLAKYRNNWAMDGVCLRKQKGGGWSGGVRAGLKRTKAVLFCIKSPTYPLHTLFSYV